MGFAAELAHTLQNAHSSAVLHNTTVEVAPPPPSPALASGIRRSSPEDPDVAGKGKANPPTDPPKKKPKAPKPQAGLHFLFGACACTTSLDTLWQSQKQGSELEVVMSGDMDPHTFVTTWVSACTSAEGRATTLKSQLLERISGAWYTPRLFSRIFPGRLEPLKSQTVLIGLITDAVTGMSEERKALQALGKSATREEVQDCLRRVTCLIYSRTLKTKAWAGQPQSTRPNMKYCLRVALAPKADPYVAAWKMHSRVAQNLNLG